MSISLEALFAIIININHIYFCIFIHVIKLMKGKRKFTPWRLSESWYDWHSVLAIVLILVVCPTKLHKNNPHLMRFKKINLMEIILHVKTTFDTSLLQNLPHIKIAVRYHNLILESICIICIPLHVINGLVPFGLSVINWNNIIVEDRGPFANMV